MTSAQDHRMTVTCSNDLHVFVWCQSCRQQLGDHRQAITLAEITALTLEHVATKET